jgi:hypothetical protein
MNRETGLESDRGLAYLRRDDHGRKTRSKKHTTDIGNISW